MSKIHLDNFWWRMDNLYTILDPHGNRVPFVLRPIQRNFLEVMHVRNIILKSRQHGFSSLSMIYMLDQALFVSGFRGGFINATLPRAKELFREKILECYEHLPMWLKELRPLLSQDKLSLRISHESEEPSSLYVDTSLRSGTFNFIHVSELAAIDEQGADKSDEIITGSLQSGLYATIVIESTARRNSGLFHDMSVNAEKKKLRGVNLSPLDYKFFFYSWYDNPDCVVDGKYVDERLLSSYADYFDRECCGIELSIEQRMWYILKLDEFSGDYNKMWREFPSNSREAFRVANKGAYYTDFLRKVYEEDRLCNYELSSYDVVNVALDIGMRHAMAVVYYVVQPNGRIIFIDYDEVFGEGLDYFRDGLKYGDHLGSVVCGHDGNVQEWTRGGQTRQEVAWSEYGVMLQPQDKERVFDGIERCKRYFGVCEFDRVKCSELLNFLGDYREDYDAKRGIYLGKPHQGPETDSADVFRYAIQSVASGDAQVSGDASISLLDLVERFAI